MKEQNSSRNPLRIFLCHCSSDKPAVRDLHRRLQADGFTPWLDEEGLAPGQDWRQIIPVAIRDCHVVVVSLSKASITKRGYVQKEINIALDLADEMPEGTIFIIPARLEEVQVPDRLTRWQWVNLFEPDGYHRLVTALQRRAANMGAASQESPVPVIRKPTTVQMTQTAALSPSRRTRVMQKPSRNVRKSGASLLRQKGGTYVYEATAKVFQGAFSRPSQYNIPLFSPISLPQSGGHVNNTMPSFREAGMSFRDAYCEAGGYFDQEDMVYSTSVTASVQEVNLMDMVTIDRVVARFTAEQRPNQVEPEISAIGSSFENLRIAGHPVQLEMGTNLISHDWDTYEKLQIAFRSSRERESVRDAMVGSDPKLSREDSAGLRDVTKCFLEQSVKDSLADVVRVSLVRRVEGLSQVGKSFGPIIVIPKFGTIILGELTVQHRRRQLTMLNVQMKSAHSGNVKVATISCGGSFRQISK